VTFVVALDVGSTSIKGALYDSRARLVRGTLAREASPIRPRPGGAAEGDPVALARRVERVLDRVMAAAGTRASKVRAVGLDVLTITLCGVDGGGRPRTPLYTYADDRAQEDVAALRRELDVAAVYQRTGCPLHTAYLPARFRWLRRTQPRGFASVRRWLDAGTLLHRRWFGRDVPMSYSVASWSGLLDRRRLRWDESLLAHLQLDRASLPALADYVEAPRGLARAHARRWPSLANVPFFLAVGDGAAANVGSGCVDPRRLALTVGTTGALRVVLPGADPEVPRGLWAYRVGKTETLLGGAFSEGGSVFAWERDVLRLPGPARIDAALRKLPPDGHGLTVLPFVAGERSPGFAPDARACIAGLTSATTSLQILQASLEAVCYRFALVARLLRPHLRAGHEVVASGGALAQSRYWLQLMADVLGHSILVSREPELTSRGTAILALRGLGEWRTLDEVALKLPRACTHDAKRNEIYQAAIERQGRLYARVIGGSPGFSSQAAPSA
jgi:gluconokinase